ncbi:MAG: pyrroline-5-carboxylate reductase [Clostridia bacterium]|nr:pyrroline-5-carboxylate reductase [Clostridia bacterium]
MRLGFIGGGNMAYAIAKGVIASELVAPFDITVNDTNEEALLKFKESGTKTTCDLKELLDCDYIILAVKPQILPSVLENIKNDYKDKVFVSIAAGVSVEKIKSLLPFNAKVIRIMPNTPALIGEGMSVLAKATAPVKDDEFKNVEEIFKSIGKTEILDENMINAVTSVSGSSPAYVFIMIEAMADAAVRDGIPRDIAYRLAAQSVLGSAKMVLETSKHPAELKDMVCSPKGTTIEAVAELEKAGFRNAIVSAMKKCTDKANNM